MSTTALLIIDVQQALIDEGPADPDALYLVSAQDQPWAGAMWAGPSRLARAAGGRVHQGLRLYPSAASR